MTFTLYFKPDLGRELKALEIPYPCEATLFIRQAAFWLTTTSGHFTRDGRKWIYNSYADWVEQITTLEPAQFGKMIRALRNLGLIVTSNFAALKNDLVNIPPVAWHQHNTTTWLTLCPERIFELTGWHPFGESTSDSPETGSQSEELEQESLKTASRADVHIRTMGSSSENNGKFSNELPSIYIENHISHQNGSTENKEKSDKQEGDGSYPSPGLQQDGSFVVKEKPQTHTTKPASIKGQYSGGSSKIQKSRTNEAAQQLEREQEVWEVVKGKPYPVFLKWWAERHYKPQGGKWETGALGYAYSEFYRNPERTTEVIFPQFLDEVRTVTERVNQAQNSDVAAGNVLPSWFITNLPEATLENVRQLMENLETLVARGVEVAVPNEANTPSSQTISYQEVEEKAQIKPLPVLNQPALVTKTCEEDRPQEEPPQDLAAMVQRRQAIWDTAPVLRPNIRKWAESTPGVIVTANGVMLESESANCEPQLNTPPTGQQEVSGKQDFKPGEGFGSKESTVSGTATSAVTDDPWESPPVAAATTSAPKTNANVWVLSLRPGQWLRFKNENDFWYKGQVVKLHQEQGYFIKVDIRYRSYGKTRHESIFRDDWLEPM